MENVILIIDLLLALALIGVVLLQRSEGGGLGMGGGQMATGRGKLDALGKITWVIGLAFFGVTLLLTIISAEGQSGASVVDRLGSGEETTAPAPELPADLGSSLLPPSASESGPIIPGVAPAQDAAPAEPAAEAPPPAEQSAPTGN